MSEKTLPTPLQPNQIKLDWVAAGVAAIDLLNALMQSTKNGALLFFLVLLATAGVVLWLNAKEHKVGLSLLLVVSAIVLSVLIFAFRSMPPGGLSKVAEGMGITRPQTTPAPPPQSYFYMRVKSYVDHNGDGKMDGADEPIDNIYVTTRDVTDETTLHPTGRDGSYLVLLRNPGAVSVGACGIYQSHQIPVSSVDPSHAYNVEIGLSPDIAKVCQKNE